MFFLDLDVCPSLNEATAGEWRWREARSLEDVARLASLIVKQRNDLIGYVMNGQDLWMGWMDGYCLCL